MTIVSPLSKPGSKNCGPVAIGALTTPLTTGALKKRGPIIASLIANWPSIAGASVAKFTVPAKISKGASRSALYEKRESAPPSHLVLQVEPSRALEVQYMLPQLLERINSALGYEAVREIRLLQVPVGNSINKAAIITPPAPQTASKPMSRLEAALARMSTAVKATALSA